MAVLISAKAAVKQGLFLYFGYGLQWQWLMADMRETAAVCGVLTLGYALLQIYIRQTCGRYTLPDREAKLVIDQDKLIYSCALKWGKQLRVTLPKQDICTVHQDKKYPYLILFEGHFVTEKITADGQSRHRRPLKKLALYDVFELELIRELHLAEYID